MSLLQYENHKLRPLRIEQQATFNEINSAIANGEKQITIQAPCGFGKTVLAEHIINNQIKQNKRVIFVAPRLTLIDQSVEVFGRDGFSEHIGVIQGRHPLTNYQKLLQVASRDTMTRRKLPRIDLLIVDECHMMTKAFAKLILSMPDVIVIGLSATPWTPGLGKIFTKLIIAPSIQELIDKDLLTKFVTYAPSPEPDLKDVKTTAGDFNQSELAEACNKPKLVADIVATWLQRGQNRLTICFCVDRAHAKHICQRFIEAGVKAEYLDCFTTDLERREILERFRNGETRILVNVNVLAVGVDAPYTSCLIDAHPTRSEMLYVQTIGRALRTFPGKINAIILDHSGNSLRHGLVTDIIRHELCDGSSVSRAKAKRKEKDPLSLRLCDSCKAVIPNHQDICPQCGTHKIKVTAIRHIDGELIEFGSGKKPSHIGPTIDQQRKFYGGLKYICAERSNDTGWIAHKFRERFGMWPDDPQLRGVMPERPTLEVINFVKARDIAFFKSRRHG